MCLNLASKAKMNQNETKTDIGGTSEGAKFERMKLTGWNCDIHNSVTAKTQ